MFRHLPRILNELLSHKHLKGFVTDAYYAKQEFASLIDAELGRAVVHENLSKRMVTPGSIVRYQIDRSPFTPARGHGQS